jgi:beta-glucanase (GH16 family)
MRLATSLRPTVRGARRLALWTLMLLGGAGAALAASAPDNHIACYGFEDPLNEMDFRRWERSSGWSNGQGFGCSWRADHVRFAGGIMALALSEARGRDHDLACGEYRTHAHHHYGRYEASMRAARGSGLITAFFIYTGPPFGDPWHELTVEILGRDTSRAQFTLFVDGEPRGTTVDLGFDAARDFHAYAIDWSPQAVRWYVDGRLMHVDEATERALPSVPGRIYAQLWNQDGLEDWAGPFLYPGRPITAEYDWIRYTPPAPAE